MKDPTSVLQATDAYRSFCRAALHLWPFSFGHTRILNFLDPPPLENDVTTTILRKYGIEFQYNPNSYIGRFIYFRGIFEEKILQTLTRVLRHGGTFIDVGSNIGLHTVVAASTVGPAGRVISLEPQSDCFRQLLFNVKLSGLTNVSAHRCAAGSKPGTARIYLVNARNSGQSTMRPLSRDHPFEEVPVVTLDSLRFARCVIKIDVEGAEMDVLLGARAAIVERRIEHIFVECIDGHLRRFGFSRRELLEFLGDMGYDTRGLIQGRWSRIGPDCKQDVDVWGVLRERN